MMGVRSSAMKKPLPPYGQELSKRHIAGREPPSEIWLFLGQGAWRYAKYHRALGKSVLILPTNRKPEDYRWPVQRCSLLVFDLNEQGADEILLKQLAWQLLKEEAEIVRLVRLFTVNPLTIFYHDRRSNSDASN